VRARYAEDPRRDVGEPRPDCFDGVPRIEIDDEARLAHATRGFSLALREHEHCIRLIDANAGAMAARMRHIERRTVDATVAARDDPQSAIRFHAATLRIPKLRA
jgi:hypothetical protein